MFDAGERFVGDLLQQLACTLFLREKVNKIIRPIRGKNG